MFRRITTISTETLLTTTSPPQSLYLDDFSTHAAVDRWRSRAIGSNARQSAISRPVIQHLLCNLTAIKVLLRSSTFTVIPPPRPLLPFDTFSSPCGACLLFVSCSSSILLLLWRRRGNCFDCCNPAPLFHHIAISPQIPSNYDFFYYFYWLWMALYTIHFNFSVVLGLSRDPIPMHFLFFASLSTFLSLCRLLLLVAPHRILLRREGFCFAAILFFLEADAWCPLKSNL